MSKNMAIAYAMKKKPTMADGGQVSPDPVKTAEAQESMRKAFHYADGGHVCSQCGYADGGVVPGEAEARVEGEEFRNKEMLFPASKSLGQYKVRHDSATTRADKEDDMVARIMASRSNAYSEGGKVANDTHPFQEDFEDPNEFDDLVLRDDLDFSDTGASSGDELGDAQEDDDRQDIVSRIMKSRRKKDKLPSPA